MIAPGNLSPNDGTDAQAARRRLWRWLPLAILVLGTLLFFAFFDRNAGVMKLQKYHQDLAVYVAAHYLSALLIYAGLYIAFVAFSLPGAVWLTIAGGYLLGALPAAIVTVIAATIGAVLVFLAARSSLGAFLHEKAGPWLGKVERGFAENQWSYLLVMRLVPVVPFFIANLIPAFLGVSLGVFVITTVLGIIPATLVYSWAGAGIGGLLHSGTELTWHNVLNPQIKLALTGLAILAALPIAVKFCRRRKGQD
jgi:uncharacterized membrane protein YdjX (TVP38/TMEM64 family)